MDKNREDRLSDAISIIDNLYQQSWFKESPKEARLERVKKIMDTLDVMQSMIDYLNDLKNKSN
jgi:hypothetical protein